MRYDTETLRSVQRSLIPHIDALNAMSGRLQHAVDRERALQLMRLFSGVEESSEGLSVLASLARIEEALVSLTALTRRGEEFVTLLGGIAEHADDAELNALQLWHCQPRRQLAGLSSPGFVSLLRSFATRADFGTASLTQGFAGLLTQALFSRTGPDFTAAALSIPLHLLSPQQQTIQARALSTEPTRAPQSLAELAQRIPEGHADSPQIRIERYGTASQPSWVVYAAGTIAMRPNARGEPWDLTSNLDLMARKKSDSQRALELSMKKAGISETDHVVFVGFSQGGMLAATLASSGRAGPTDLVTFGAPVSHLDLSSVGTVIAVEHHEDLVPALGGDASGSANDRTVLRASAQVPLAQEDSLPAHNLQRYTETAHRLDSQSGSSTLAAQQRRLFSDLIGSGTSSLWRASRTAPAD